MTTREEMRSFGQEIVRSRQDREREVANICSRASRMLKGFQDAHAAMSREMKDRLATEDADRRREVDATLATLGGARLAMSQDVKQQRSEARQFMGEFARVLAEGKAAPTAEEAPPDMPLRDRVFAYLASHPGGARMSGMEQELRAARIQVAKAVRGLMDENRVEKRDLLYFAR